MHTLQTISSNYTSLEGILEKLKSHPIVVNSPEVLDRVELALLFHRDMMDDMKPFFEEYYEMIHEKYLDETKHEEIAGETFERIIDEYRLLVENGVSAASIIKVAQAKNWSALIRVRVLATLFGYSVQEAKEIDNKVLGEQRDSNEE